MKKTSIAIVLALLVLSGLAVAQEKELSNTATDKLDAETRALVARVYPAFVMIGGGSGVCISEDGYFITNHHVWSEAYAPSTKPVKMAGVSKRFTADSVGADSRGDIVLGKIRLGEGEKVPFVKLADSDKVKVGDVCLAIGNPFLLSTDLESIGGEPTVSLGTVTATHRFQGGYNDAIQIDTAINPGNSGGPSFNVDGEVIGINGRNIASHGKRFNTGAGYAIPSTQISNFLPALKANEGGARLVRHGIVGGLKVELGISVKGARVSSVDDDTEAADAGFKVGDLITEMDGREVYNGFRYYGIIGTCPRNSVFKFNVKRGAETVEISARNDVPTETGQFGTIPRTDDQARSAGGGNIMTGDPFRIKPPEVGLRAYAVQNKDRKVGGYILTRFGRGSPLEGAGLKEGDIITQVNGRRISHYADYWDVALALKVGAEVTIKYLREGAADEVKVQPVAKLASPANGR